MFSKLNFLLPLTNTSTSLKIRNVNGIVVYVIKEPTCTISINNNILIIKQNAESSTINLQFASNIEAADAHILLRTQLKQLNIIINSNNGNIQPSYYSFLSLDTTVLHVDSYLTISVTFIDIKKFYVNGIFISSPYYGIDVNNQRIIWKANNDYIIELDDELMIEYI